MKSEGPMDTVRTFVAIELAPDILTRLEDLLTRMKRDLPPGLVRWVRPAGIHLTLKFLGEVPANKVDAIAEAMRDACTSHPPFSFAINGLGCFPNPRRPRVIWVGVDEPSGTLAHLQRDVERAMKPLGFAPEERKFHPHLTLGRVKRGTPGELRTLSEYISHGQAKIGEMQATSVSLIRSDLRPDGAVYTELAAALLSG
jgi:2'-5' RNA ligase